LTDHIGEWGTGTTLKWVSHKVFQIFFGEIMDKRPSKQKFFFTSS
jgi:hypothetical protein